MNHTTNYQLSQWERTDQVKMEDFNADNAKLDGALGGHEGRVAALEALAPHWGNCQIEIFSYSGTGETGRQITFPAVPTFFVIIGSAALMGCGGVAIGYYMGWVPSGNPNGGSVISVSGAGLSWNGNRMQIVSEAQSKRMNENNSEYQVISFYSMD